MGISAGSEGWVSMTNSPGRPMKAIVLSKADAAALRSVVRRPSSSMQAASRAKMILLAGEPDAGLSSGQLQSSKDKGKKREQGRRSGVPQAKKQALLDR